MTQSDEKVTIATESSIQADMIRAYLESHGISVFLHGEFLGSVAPHVAAPGGVGAVRIQIPSHQEEEARLLLKQMASLEGEQGNNDTESGSRD